MFFTIVYIYRLNTFALKKSCSKLTDLIDGIILSQVLHEM